MAGSRRKTMVRSHIMEFESIQLIKDLLPSYWVPREYKPDYGLDLAVEVFKAANDDPTKHETLGEHFFVQAKAIENLKEETIVVHPRLNVAKHPFQEPEGTDESKPIKINVHKFKVDTTLLSTVQAMGASQVVLLFLVALDKKRIFFICLNDYVDKVLVPENPDYDKNETKTILIPLRNEISEKPEHLIPIRFYAKRSKFYAAFNLFYYQLRELEWCNSWEELRAMARHFIKSLKHLDIWHDIDMWQIINYYNERMLLLEKKLQEPIFPIDDWFDQASLPPMPLEKSDEFYLATAREAVIDFWRGLTVTGRNYEELCREWFLPTHLAQYLSYPDYPEESGSPQTGSE